MELLTILSIVFSVVYSGFFVFVSIGFLKSIKIKRKLNTQEVRPVSIVIPFKNEEQNLPLLIDSLNGQINVVGEVIFVNDHSSDNSLAILQKAGLKNFEIRIIELEADEYGKKTALEKGIKVASHDLIITKDADCVFSVNHISAHVMAHMNGEKLVAGSVDILPEKGMWNVFQQLELLGIQMISNGIAYWFSPIAISGANLSYSKRLFLNLNPYETNRTVLSGDDIFLLQKAKKRKVLVETDQTADMRVFTPGQSLKGYLHQHIRWMKKKSSFLDPMTVCTGFILFFSSFLFLFLAGYQIIFKGFRIEFMIYAGIKMWVDFLLLFLITQQRGNQKLLLMFIPSFLMNIFFTSLLPVIGWLVPVTWKGRKV